LGFNLKKKCWNKPPVLEGLSVCFLKMKKEVNNDNPQISQELRNMACGKWMFKSLSDSSLGLSF